MVTEFKYLFAEFHPPGSSHVPQQKGLVVGAPLAAQLKRQSTCKIRPQDLRLFQAPKVSLLFVGLGPEVKGCLGAITKMPRVYHEKRGLSIFFGSRP